MRRVLQTPANGDWQPVLEALVDEGPELTALVLGSGRPGVPPTGTLGDLTDVLFAFPDLESLTVFGTDVELDELPLESLRVLRWCVSGFDISPLLADLTALETLELWSGPDPENPEGLLRALAPLDALSHLSIRFRMALDPYEGDHTAFEAIADSAVLERLETLELTDMGLTEDDVEPLLANPEPWADMRLVLDRNALPDFTVALLQRSLGDVELSIEDQDPENAPSFDTIME